MYPLCRHCVAVLLLLSFALAARAQDAPSIAFQQKENALLITIGNIEFATYTLGDANNTRSFFSNLRAPGGILATRNYPPKEGDQTDHPHHQGIFFTFGDLNGIDYWHTKGKAPHVKFRDQPKGGMGQGTFTVENKYLSIDEKDVLCSEIARWTIRTTKEGHWIELDTTITATASEVRFGSKEKGGIAARMQTPLAVINGGRMVDSKARVNGEQVWGNTAHWVDYTGKLKDQFVGITIFAHPDNPRPSWWHARDYGLFAANPFGPLNSKEGGLTLKKGEQVRFRYAVLVHAGARADSYSAADAYKSYLKR
jgi:hypothetical protein